MDAVVLGVSMTPSTVGLVLVEGCEADGATVDHDAFDIRGYSSSATAEICDRVVVAARRAERAAAERGQRLAAVGVTWSTGAGAEAAVLLTKLAEAEIAEVVPVRLPQATDALARRVAGIVGFGTTGVCVLEPDVVQAMTVTGDDQVQTTVSRGIETVAGLTDWLSVMFDEAEHRPDALVVVGSAVDLDSVLPKVERALAVPVFTPAEPGLPLARGAALASAQRRAVFGDDGVIGIGRRWAATHLTPLAILVGGVVAFAVSLSVAIGQQLVPGAEPTPQRTTRPVVSTSVDSVSVPPTPAVVVPAPAPPAPDPPPMSEPVEQQAVEPEYVLDQSGTVLPENTGLWTAPSEPGVESVPPEWQSPPPETIAEPPPELEPVPAAPDLLPADQLPPAPEVAPPPLPEPPADAAPPPPEVVAPEPQTAPPAPEPVPAEPPPQEPPPVAP
ncbi:hypothetical protein A5733_06035 [Mycobacterium sp. NS-7484]|uniref:DUF7159 family protein n=1 Tax=Mycobacterium sp. NS-7484 TaxID=1834161 RepID=UPI00096C2FB6|nr:hypothetical protein [Mycobacterium sp. NS-7484]OMB99427.1 hypothetical protein A5733_06035 [Mycobacterium sp. NS-7484]